MLKEAFLNFGYTEEQFNIIRNYDKIKEVTDITLLRYLQEKTSFFLKKILLRKKS